MDYLAAIAYVNRPDLLRKALASVKPYWKRLTVIDNSPGRELRGMDLQAAAPGSRLFVPPVPYSFAQTMNLLHRLGAEQRADTVIFMHNDAEAYPGTPEKFLEALAHLQSGLRRWGAAFTNYHTLVAFNMRAVRKVGPWDIILPRYYGDYDYYRRLALSGYELVHTKLRVHHHDGGANTVKADPKLKFNHDIMMPLYLSYYEKKWGGRPGRERYALPFKTFPHNPVKNYLKVFYE